MREIRTSGSVRGEEGNLLTYSTCEGKGQGAWLCAAPPQGEGTGSDGEPSELWSQDGVPSHTSV